MAKVRSARAEDTGAELQEPSHVPPSASERRKCLLVLGMHRSGTSALSGLLANLGAQRPKRELGPQPDNQLGFFEPSEVVAIHDRFLCALSSNWFDWRALPHDWRANQCFEAALHDLEAAVRHDFDGNGTFLVKDPRICRFVDLWIALTKRVRANLVTIHIFRTPLEVASSLRVRNGFNEAEMHLLWLRHVLEAEVATRCIPRAYVSYEALLADGLQEVERALQFVDVGIDADVSARAAAATFVDPSFKHQAVGANGVPEALGRWTELACALLARLREAPNDRTTLKRLDRLRSDFDAGCEAFGPMFTAVSARTRELEPQIHRLRIVEEEREVLVRSLQAVSWVADRIPVLEAELDSARGRLSEMTAVVGRADALDREVAGEREKRLALETIAARVPELEHQLMAVRAQLEAMESASQESAGILTKLVADHDRLGAEFSERLAARDAELAGMRRELATLSPQAERVPNLEAELAAIRAESACRVETLEHELGDERRRHDETKRVADRFPAAQADCARLNTQLVETEIVADRVPHLEKALADAQARAELLARQLGSRKELIRRLVFKGA